MLLSSPQGPAIQQLQHGAAYGGGDGQQQQQQQAAIAQAQSWTLNSLTDLLLTVEQLVHCIDTTSFK